MGGFSGYGLRALTDNWFTYYQPSVLSYLRYQVYDPSSTDFAQLGFIPTVTGVQSGVVDYPIVPPPDVVSVSLHNIGLNAGRLEFGAKTFRISHTFVLQQMLQFGYSSTLNVWRNPSVIGIRYQGEIFSIESITHQDIGGEPIIWNLVCNFSQTLSPTT